MDKKMKVALVGAGPGDTGLLTIRGLQLLQEADCVIYDRLLNKRMLEVVKDSCEKIYMGKEKSNHTLPQDEINELLLKKAKEHSLVVRLKGGDPYVFGRGGEEALFLTENNVEVEVVPGITSAIAAPAAAGIPVTHRGLSKGFKVITAHSKKDELSDLSFEDFLDESITYVFLMGLSHLEEIARGLMDAGRNPDTPVAVIQSGTTVRQKKCIGSLSDIAKRARVAGLISPAVIVVGSTVSLNEELSFFEKRPLSGRKYLLPKIESLRYGPNNVQSSGTAFGFEEQLEREGAEVISVKSGRILPIKADLSFAESVTGDDFIAFTSANGVRAFFYNLYEICGRDVRDIPKCRYAVVGRKTGQVLKSFGINADVISEKQTAEDLIKTIAKAGNNGWLYWLCGRERSYEETDQSILKRLRIVTCYETVKCEDEISENESAYIAGLSGAIFTSGFNARFAFEKFSNLPEKLYSIGPGCTREIKKLTDRDALEAKLPSYDGLLEVLMEDAAGE